jgi:cytoskeletal protein RodZ
MEKGISLEELQEITKIRGRYIEAIESGDYSVLPGTFYARAFIKNIAEVLGMDPQQVLSQFEGELPKANPAASEAIKQARPVKTTIPTPSSRWFTRGIVYLFVILLASLTYYLIVENLDPQVEHNDSVPPGMNTEVTTPDGGTASPTTPGTGNETGGATPTPAPATPPTTETPDANTVEVLYNKTGSVGRTEADYYTVNGAEELVVTLKFKGDCWFSFNQGDANGEIIESVTLQGGAERTWKLKDSAWLKLGNPPAVEMTINGHPVNTADRKQPKGYLISWKAPKTSN